MDISLGLLGPSGVILLRKFVHRIEGAFMGIVFYLRAGPACPMVAARRSSAVSPTTTIHGP
jgi:hypothetical protein